jgi:signal transduction histidine kinase/ActR/RegA family two-component response regulator
VVLLPKQSVLNIMRPCEEKFYSISPPSVLELIKTLTVGQRTVNTVEDLAVFLHTTVFPQLGPFATQILFRDEKNDVPGYYAKSAALNGWVPSAITFSDPLLATLRTEGKSVSFAQPSGLAIFTDSPHSRHLLAPIDDAGETLAILYLGGNGPSFDPFYLETVNSVTATIGSRLKSLKVIHRQKEAMCDLAFSEKLRTALNEINEEAHKSVDIGDLCRRLHRTVGHLISAENFFVALIEQRDDDRFLTLPYCVDSRDNRLQGMECELDQKLRLLTTHLIKTRRPLLLTPDTYHAVCDEHQLRPIGSEPHSWLGAPFYLDDQAGAVVVKSYEKIVYTEKDKELLAYVARQLGDALKRKKAVEALETAKNRAEAAEKNKRTFLANMSHEIRTPMNGILGLTDLLLKSDISGRQRTYLELVQSSADRLLKIINDILDFSKIEAGKLELNIAPFSLRHTIADALEILAINAAKKDIAMIIECDEQIADKLMGDADKLHQILVNLVGNAIKFTNRGSVTLSVCPAGTLAGQDLIDLCFQVKDTGIGIPADEIGNVFTSFRQLGTTRGSKNRGTGLGLVIAAELVGMMGGKICVESNPGIGTIFYFSIRFPLAPLPTEEPLACEQPSSPHLPEVAERLRILLVEDEFVNRTLAVTVLEREGWLVRVAENGKQALQLLENHNFDVVLMDIQMPEMNGYEATIAIRNREQGDKHLPIIAMTAYAVKGDREKCLASGMDGYISKPINLDRLREEIEAVLRLQRRRQQSPGSR